MKKILVTALALALCLTACLCFSSCKKEVSEEEWRAAFAFENVRIDFAMHEWDIEAREWESEASEQELFYNGTHYLLDGENVAIANVKMQLIGDDKPTVREKYFIQRETLMRLFDFADRFEEFELLEGGTYFCESSSLKNVFWDGDCIEEVSVSFSDGKVERITYSYATHRGGLPSLHIYTFSEYGQVTLEAPSAS